MAESMTESRTRRGAGRQARIRERTSALADELKPVRPGQIGGRYRVLDDSDIERIQASVFEILDRVGLAAPTPSVVEHCTRAGARLGDDGRLCFPEQTVRDALAKACRKVTLYARDPARDLVLEGQRVHFGTGGAAVHIVDARTGEYRDSVLRDIYDMARVVDCCEHIHFYYRTVVARDLPDMFELDVNTHYAMLQGTIKHVGGSFSIPRSVNAVLEMAHEVAGSEAAWRERPFISTNSCFVVPPLTFAEDACNCLELAVLGGMPVNLLSAGQAGATGPAALAGTVVQEMAECLAALVYVNAIKPGAPAILGMWPFVSDLRTGAMSGGSGEQAILMCASAQVAQSFGIPVSVAGAMTDSKMPDIQSGFEKGCNQTLIGNSGANMIYESAGMHASLLGACYESLVLDNDSLGAALRTVRGVEVNDSTLSVDVISEVTLNGPNHFLGAEQTLQLMQTEYIYPELCDRLSPKEWKEQNQEVALDRAEARVAEILAEHFPNPVSPGADARIRDKLPIRLEARDMRPR
ncbi:MAG: trimethylamine methyltransferase family protein [Rhodobacteraceae bacterium]|nr:trimethylamine methyltransferase family protein [Paracoccaceae bacterium]